MKNFRHTPIHTFFTLFDWKFHIKYYENKKLQCNLTQNFLQSITNELKYFIRIFFSHAHFELLLSTTKNLLLVSFSIFILFRFDSSSSSSSFFPSYGSACECSQWLLFHIHNIPYSIPDGDYSCACVCKHTGDTASDCVLVCGWCIDGFVCALGLIAFVFVGGWRPSGYIFMRLPLYSTPTHAKSLKYNAYLRVLAQSYSTTTQLGLPGESHDCCSCLCFMASAVWPFFHPRTRSNSRSHPLGHYLCIALNAFCAS